MDPSSIAYVICLVSLITICITAKAQRNVFNVLSYGAAGNGLTDDSLAFMKAWKDTCSAAAGTPTLIIPKGKIFLVHQITFTGPCKSNKINVKLSGTIIAPNGPDQWKAADLSTWLAFQGVNGLTIDGLGMIDGRGKGWWDRSCKFHRGQQGCITLAPTVLKFENCNNIHMSNIKFHNSPQTHVLILGCQNVDFGFLTIQAPGTSPNTDGIHIQVARNVSIHNSQFADGDDCISIGDRTSDISITDISCGPGHGVSIGSLGRGGADVQVNNINVRRVNFRGTTNGVRIKTWQGGRGIVRNVSFSSINFQAVANPIIIDQFYCDIPNSCRKSNTAVHISGVRFSQLFGTSKTKVGINLNCSSNIPCTGITLEDIHLASATSDSQLISSCNNAFGLNRGIIDPKSCLRKII
ncbi:probable polygalacturonase At1g80170 [Durio zibethinus]|uniref:endo-polygalacturonase n=1 Tax=Durio zibethinus TaxID=66656 RepID=A0A6P5WZC9_DURZI|nr:probable polygalacturonase At1g80170 [Durio zibethinus]